MLGVEAWLAVPFFSGRRAGSADAAASAAAHRDRRRRGHDRRARSQRHQRPVFALAAASPLIATPPVAAGELMTTLGASIEPFLYVLVLWQLRRRPAVFGAVLCAGTLHREFTIFAAPAAAAALWLEGRRFEWRAIAKTAAAFALVWAFVDLLKRVLPPATRVGSARRLAPQRGHRHRQVAVDRDAEQSPAHTSDVVLLGLPGLLGVHPRAFWSYGYDVGFTEGS